MEKYQFAFHSVPFGNNRLYLSPYRRGQKSHTQKSGKGKVCRHKE